MGTGPELPGLFQLTHIIRNMDQDKNPGDGKETSAGGWHNELPADAIKKAVGKKASFPGDIGNAAGMDASPEHHDDSRNSQPQKPEPPAGNTITHTSDG